MVTLSSGVMLFDEDFDRPPASSGAPEPEVIEPIFSAAELAAAREEAALESREAALAEVDDTAQAAARRALAAIAAEIAAARDTVRTLAEQSSEAIARLLLDCFATAFPALSARHGTAEVAAVLRAILPALHREPVITVRLNPHLAEAMAAEIATMDPDLAERVRVIPTDAMAAEDVRIAWDQGSATRDTKALWSHIESIPGTRRGC